LAQASILSALEKISKTPYIQVNRATLTMASFMMVFPTENSTGADIVFFMSFSVDDGYDFQNYSTKLTPRHIPVKVFTAGQVPLKAVFSSFSSVLGA
jgi:hypothetical protein